MTPPTHQGEPGGQQDQGHGYFFMICWRRFLYQFGNILKQIFIIKTFIISKIPHLNIWFSLFCYFNCSPIFSHISNSLRGLVSFDIYCLQPCVFSSPQPIKGHTRKYVILRWSGWPVAWLVVTRHYSCACASACDSQAAWGAQGSSSQRQQHNKMANTQRSDCATATTTRLEWLNCEGKEVSEEV